MNRGSRHAQTRPERLVCLLEPVITAAGLELESVRVGRAGRRALLRVVVDAERGVSLDDIAEVSRRVADAVDAAGAMGPGAYTLEVSSPGVDRPLTEPRHWRRAAGRLVRATVPAAGPGTAPGDVEGRVVSAGPSGVTLEIGGEHREFGYSELGPGRMQVEFGGGPADRGQQAGGEDVAGGAEPNGH